MGIRLESCNWKTEDRKENEGPLAGSLTGGLPSRFSGLRCWWLRKGYGSGNEQCREYLLQSNVMFSENTSDYLNKKLKAKNYVTLKEKIENINHSIWILNTKLFVLKSLMNKE